MRKRAETRQVEEAASSPDRVDESGEPVQQLRIGRIERQPIEVTVEGGDTADRFGQKFLKQIVHCPDNPCHARLPILRCILLAGPQLRTDPEDSGARMERIGIARAATTNMRTEERREG